MPGVIVQAHMVSQLINAGLEQRPLFQTWADWREVSWIGAWAIIGTVLAGRWGGQSSVLLWGRVMVISTLSLFGLCFSALLLQGTFIPFAPSLLALILSSSSVLVYGRLQSQQRRTLRSQELILKR